MVPKEKEFMPRKPFINRRNAIRAKRILSIQYRLIESTDKSPDKRWYLSTTNDMSAVGVSFLSEAPFLIDDILELQIIMSGVVDVFTGYGKVVRIERKQAGGSYFVAIKIVEYKPKKSRPKKKPSTSKNTSAKKRKK